MSILDHFEYIRSILVYYIFEYIRSIWVY